MLLAVLHRHAGVSCFDQDVFVNAVGGMKISEPATDLAVLLAIISSIRNRALPKGLVVFGEIGLASEVRDRFHRTPGSHAPSSRAPISRKNRLRGLR